MVVTKNQEFFRHVNEAFFTGDQEFISQNVTEDVVWTMVGSEPIRGKQAFLDAAFGVGGFMQMEFTIDSLITHGMDAAVKGTMIMTDEGSVKTYAYSDFYRLNKPKEGKIQELTSFVIELKQ